MSSFIRGIIIPHHDPYRLSLSIRHLPLSSTSSRRRAHTSSTTKDLVHKLPQVRTCPPPSCPCAEMPSGLDINHDRELYGTMPPYSEHVIIRTGRADWGSRIEEEEVGDVAGVEGTAVNFARSLKMLTGRGGKYHDPNRPVLISNCSLPPSHPPNYLSAHVFPSNIRVPRIGHSVEDHEAFVAQFLGDRTTLMRRASIARKIAHNFRSGLDAAGLPTAKENTVPPRGPLQYMSIDSAIILLCGHNSRDTRCGILGPLLKAEFDSYLGLGRKIWSASDDDFNEDGSIKKSILGEFPRVRTALVSHIGGHVWAGNVIIYLPKRFKTANGSGSQLAGKGIWYGRVEPRHVQGIMEETFRKGNLIRDLLRGIHMPGSLNQKKKTR